MSAEFWRNELRGGLLRAQTSDGGFIVGGLAVSGGGGNKADPGFGDADFWLVRLDRSGNTRWDRSYGGDKTDVAFDLRQTSGGGFIVAGFSNSSNTGNKTSPHVGTGDDGWVVRLDADGNKLWDRSFNNANWERFYSVQQTCDGGFVLSGDFYSSSAWFEWHVLWIDAHGNLRKERTFGGIYSEYLPSIRLMPDGSYAIAGRSGSPPSGNKTSPAPGGFGSDLWLVRLDDNGKMLWDKSHGGVGIEQWASIDPTADGGFALAISSQSSSSGNKITEGFGREDIWVVRVDEEGNKLWEQSLGGSLEEIPALNVIIIRQTADGVSSSADRPCLEPTVTKPVRSMVLRVQVLPKP